ncbi:FKBP12-associated protein [Haplosporangium sp. Z 767]|nr:FKBP12-associated protein [Haplosporangium sp. Z 767]
MFDADTLAPDPGPVDMPHSRVTLVTLTPSLVPPCMCRKSKMPNVPCYKNNPSCGKICGKRLDCNLHTCIKSCHSGECILPPSDVCSQPCPKLRKSCGHRCGVACHGDLPCPEDQPCQVTVPSSCKCGHLTMESACNATAENPLDGKSRIIKCNDYCLIAERNKRVALALEIEEGEPPGPRIPDYDPYVLDYAAANMEFTLKIEKQLAEWVADTTKPILYFSPMKGHRRKFVHELAANYNVTSESVDVEPYRSVNVRRQLDTSVPGLLASQACRQKRSTSSTSNSVGLEQLRKPMIKDPVNAIYLHDLEFGLTRTELAAQLAPIFGNIKYGIRWLTDDDAVLVPHPGSMQMDELEVVLVRLRTGIKAIAAKGNLCERVELCWVNKDGEVVSHTSVGGSQARRFFNSSQGSQLMKKTGPPKITNAFALLDDDERVAAAKKAEEERIMKAKEAAGTLSSDAWEEASASTTIVPPLPPIASVDSHTAEASGLISASAPGISRSDSALTGTTEDLTKFVVVEAGEFTDEVVDDWQELLGDDEDEKEAKETDVNEDADENDGDQDKAATKDKEEVIEETPVDQDVQSKTFSSKGSSDDEVVLISPTELCEYTSEQTVAKDAEGSVQL